MYSSSIWPQYLGIWYTTTIFGKGSRYRFPRKGKNTCSETEKNFFSLWFIICKWANFSFFFRRGPKTFSLQVAPLKVTEMKIGWFAEKDPRKKRGKTSFFPSIGFFYAKMMFSFREGSFPPGNLSVHIQSWKIIDSKVLTGKGYATQEGTSFSFFWKSFHLISVEIRAGGGTNRRIVGRWMSWPSREAGGWRRSGEKTCWEMMVISKIVL